MSLPIPHRLSLSSTVLIFFLYNGKAEGGAGEEWAMEIKTELWCFENKRLRRL